MSSRSKRRTKTKVEEESSQEETSSQEEVISESEEESEEETPPPPKKKRGRPRKTTTKKAPAKKKAPAPASAKKGTGKRKFKVLLETVRPGDKSSPKPDSKKLSAGGGHYTGNNPMQAAKKAFTRICRSVTDGGSCSYIFSVKETSRGSKGKTFTYRGERVELDEPKELKKGNSTFKIRFNTSLKAYKGK